jgi:hypothetical protein
MSKPFQFSMLRMLGEACRVIGKVIAFILFGAWL